MIKKPSDRYFQELARQVNETIISNEGMIGDQQDQVELVYSLEKKFKNQIQKYVQCESVYQAFIEYIKNEAGNILSAKPFFRERVSTFNKKISKSIKNNKPKALMKFDINYKLVEFIVQNWKGKFPERAKKIYIKYVEARRILIENNMPLAINRAKLFYRKTPESSLSLLDLIDICILGLITGVDKHAGPYNKVWRSVCIGSMVGYMIEEYSKTFIRMYPVDKKILYRANALRYRLKIEDIEKLTEEVNESFLKDKKMGRNTPKLPISSIHILSLMNSSSYLSADNSIKSVDNSSDSEDNAIDAYNYASDDSVDTEEAVIFKDYLEKLGVASKELTIIERKILRLKGVSL